MTFLISFSHILLFYTRIVTYLFFCKIAIQISISNIVYSVTNRVNPISTHLFNYLSIYRSIYIYLSIYLYLYLYLSICFSMYASSTYVFMCKYKKCVCLIGRPCERQKYLEPSSKRSHSQERVQNKPFSALFQRIQMDCLKKYPKRIDT